MKYHNTLIAFGTILLIAFSLPVSAGPGEETAQPAAAADDRQAQMEAEYRATMAEAKESQQAAEAALERTRENAQRAAERAQRADEESQRASAEREAELAAMYEELNRARRELQETSREVARVSREVAQARAGSRTYVYQATQRPVIGVVLGDADETGIKVIGVSPDGPAERAGIEQGDILVSMGGYDLSAGTGDESGSGLEAAKGAFKAGEPVLVTYRRDDKLIDVDVVPEVREPLGWHTITRFPSAPEAPDEIVTIERLVVPQLDTAELAERLENIRIEIADRAHLAAPGAPALPDAHELELHALSELGDSALWETNEWFGLPLTRSLKLAGIDPGLGEYFKTDRGVLVLKAEEGNDLQLESGDVILDVGDTAVNSPAEFMRALRDIQAGEEVLIAIKRERKNKTLKSTMPERKLGFFFPAHERNHNITHSYSTD
jgi:hypothetical protein